jgi:hypothetical protein
LLLPPSKKIYKLPSYLTWDKYNYEMCAQVILTYVGGGGTYWVKIFQSYTSNAVTAVATAKATWYSDIPLYSNTTQTC